MEKRNSNNLDNTEQGKPFSLSISENYQELVERILDIAANKIWRPDSEKDLILHSVRDFLYSFLSIKTPSERWNIFCCLAKRERTAKEHSADLEAIRLLLDIIVDEGHASKVLKYTEEIIRDELQHKQAIIQNSADDLKVPIWAAQDFLGIVLANEGGGKALKWMRSENIAFRQWLYNSLMSLYIIRQINESIIKDKSATEQSNYLKFMILGFYFGEAMNPQRYFMRELQESFLKMGASDGVTEERWAPLDRLRLEAKIIADNQWSQEDEISLHNAIAKFIYDSIKSEFMDLRQREAVRLEKINSKRPKKKKKKLTADELADEFLIKTIMDEIIPVAEKWEPIKGRILIWGKKGVKKPKK